MSLVLKAPALSAGALVFRGCSESRRKVLHPVRGSTKSDLAKPIRSHSRRFSKDILKPLAGFTS